MKNRVLSALTLVPGLFSVLSLSCYADVVFVPSVSSWDPIALIIVLVVIALAVAGILLLVIRKRKKKNKK